jgi:hypothetical protein
MVNALIYVEAGGQEHQLLDQSHLDYSAHNGSTGYQAESLVKIW